MGVMRERWAGVPKWMKILLYAVLGAAGLALMGFVFGWLIQHLWNWLMPEIFGLGEIAFWQAVGLFLLARILFGISGGKRDGDSKVKSARKRMRGGESGDQGDQGWRRYDEWWQSEGKKAFRDYAERMNAQSEDRADDAE